MTGSIRLLIIALLFAPAIAVAQALVGCRRLPSREHGRGNGASGSRQRQKRGRAIMPMLSLCARGFVPSRGRFQGR